MEEEGGREVEGGNGEVLEQEREEEEEEILI